MQNPNPSGQLLRRHTLEHQAGRLMGTVQNLRLLKYLLLSLCCASLTSLDLAFGALVYEPMWAGVAGAAVPEDESCVRLDHLEAVGTGT